MAELFNNKFRIKSIRLKHWDYSSNGAYFVTICTKNRECVLGNVVNRKIVLSQIGKIVFEEWAKTEQIREYVKLDTYVIMPNHLHGIIIIENNNIGFVETHGHASLRKNKFGPQCRNLPAIIRGFKGASAKQIKLMGYRNFAWQPRFYEHIIRNENDMNRIREYVINNPLQWEFDNENLPA